MSTNERVEQNIVEALLGAAAFRTEQKLCEIKIERDGKILFTFKIHGLTEDEFTKCRKQNTKNRGRRDEETNWTRYAAQVIYEATVADDKKLLWQNHEGWQALNVVSGVDVVNQVLTPAEKSKILEAVESISGFDDNLDGLIQNL